jgi:hypothetical protein
MWWFRFDSSTTLATKCECSGSVSILQLHFVAGKSNMIDCIFITLQKDFCGRLVLGGNMESICHYWRGCEFCIPKDMTISFRPHTVSRDNIHFGPILRLQSWGMRWDSWGAHLNVVATFILSCFALLKFEGIVVVPVSPIWGTKKKKKCFEKHCAMQIVTTFFFGLGRVLPHSYALATIFKTSLETCCQLCCNLPSDAHHSHSIKKLKKKIKKLLEMLLLA